jgi:uncharacterized protein YkwD
MTLGSSVDCDLVLPSKDISDRHCRIEPAGASYRIVDLHSETGTRVNDREVGRTGLQLGDAVMIGPYVLVLLEGAGNRTAAPAAVTPSAAPVMAASAAAAAVSAARAPRQAPRAVRTPLEAAAARPALAGPRPRRREPDAVPAGTGAFLGFVLVAIGAFVVWNVFFDAAPAPADSVADSHLDRARELMNQCEFDEIRALLVEIEDSKPSRADQRRVREFEDKLEVRERRYREADAELTRLAATSDPTEFEAAYLAAERLLGKYADIAPIVHRAQRMGEDFGQRIPDPSAKYQGLLAGLKSQDEILAEVGKKLEDGNFQRALALLDAAASRKGADQDRIRESREYVDSVAAEEGKALLELVDEFMGKGKLLVALNYLTDDDLRVYRGTAIWREFMRRAEEVEDRIDETMPAEARPVARRKHLRDDARGPALSEIGEPADVPRHLVMGQARSALEKGNFGEALEMLEDVMKRTSDPKEISGLQLLVERARQPQKLLEYFVRSTQTRPPSNLKLQLRTGENARFGRSDGESLYVSMANEERRVALDDIEPDSLLRATSKIRLDAEGSVGRAFLALACRDDKALAACLENAAKDPGLQGLIDIAVAAHRGLDAVPPGGYTFFGGEWMTEAELEDRGRDQAIRDAIQSLAREAGEDRGDAFEALRLYVTQNPGVTKQLLLERRAELADAFTDSYEKPKLEKLLTRRMELEAARVHALDLIYDTERYFYPYRPPACPPDKARLYPEVQQEVDARVQAVRDIWGKEGESDLHVACQMSEESLLLAREVQLVDRLLDPLGVLPADAEDPLRLARMVPSWTRKVTLRNFAKDAAERQRLDADEEILAANSAATDVDAQDLEQVLVTNQYRRMLGRAALRFQPQIYQAAIWHSEYQSRKGELTHFEEDPETKTPTARMRKFGYRQGAGENCSWGRGGAVATHDGWIHSSGHHRNLLLDTHTEMASAQKGAYWTQKFGGRKAYDGNF